MTSEHESEGVRAHVGVRVGAGVEVRVRVSE